MRLQGRDRVLEHRSSAHGEQHFQPDDSTCTPRGRNPAAGGCKAREAEPHHGPVGDLPPPGSAWEPGGEAPGHDLARDGHPEAVHEEPGQHVDGGLQRVHAVDELQVRGDEVEESPVHSADEELLHDDDGDCSIAEHGERDHRADLAVQKPRPQESCGADAADDYEGYDARVRDWPAAAGLREDD